MLFITCKTQASNPAVLVRRYCAATCPTAVWSG